MAPKINLDTLMEVLPYQRKRGKWKSLQLDWKKEWKRFDAKKLFKFDLADIPEDKLNAARERKNPSWTAITPRFPSSPVWWTDSAAIP
jgi:hypothetical protein